MTDEDEQKLVGIVLVSHSAAVADSVAELAKQLSGGGAAPGRHRGHRGDRGLSGHLRHGYQ